MWACTVAVAVAAVSILVNFVWLPCYPKWTVLIIAFDVFVIWRSPRTAGMSPGSTTADHAAVAGYPRPARTLTTLGKLLSFFCRTEESRLRDHPSLIVIVDPMRPELSE